MHSTPPPNLWHRRTRLLLIGSHSLLALSAALYVVGVATYFANFNLGSGGDAQGGLLLLSGALLGILAVIGIMLSVAAAVVTYRQTGADRLLVLSLVMPLVELLLGLVIFNSL